MAKRGRPKGSKNKPKEKVRKRPSRPGEGGQPGNKNAEKWTEEKALNLANELIEWMLPKFEDNKKGKKVDVHGANIFYEEFLIMHKKIYSTVLNYLEKKYESFSKTLKTARHIQKIKLMKHATAGNLKEGSTIFILKNYHDMSDKVEHSGNREKPVILQVSPDFMPGGGK